MAPLWRGEWQNGPNRGPVGLAEIALTTRNGLFGEPVGRPGRPEVRQREKIDRRARQTLVRCRSLRSPHTNQRGTLRRVTVVLVAAAILLGAALPAVAQDGSVGVVDTSTGEWYLLDPAGGTARFFYGNPGDIPFVGDWDCDGDETPGLYRQSDGFVYLRNSNTQGPADIRFFFGNPGDFPLAGDFNGDVCDSVSIYRPAESRIYIINELGANDGGLGAADFSYIFGNPGDNPFVGDFDADGTDEVGLHRESTGLVYFRLTHTQGPADSQFIFGDPGDKIIAAEWARRGAPGPETVGLFRPSNCNIFLRYTNSQGVADETTVYGMSTGLPVAGDFGVLTVGGSPPAPCTPQPPPPPPPPGDGCPGTIGAIIIDDNLEVPNGTTCTLNGTTVEGNVIVGSAATLVASDVSINGNIQSGGHASVTVNADSMIGGDIQLESGSRARVESSSVDGNIQMESNGGSITISSNVVGGDIQVNSNTGGVEIRGNTVDGNLQCESNNPAPTGGNNTVMGNKEGQCSGL